MTRVVIGLVVIAILSPMAIALSLLKALIPTRPIIDPNHYREAIP